MSSVIKPCLLTDAYKRLLPRKGICGAFQLFQGYSADAATSPRNLFDVYKKNPHWLGVYKRKHVVKEKLPLHELNDKIHREKLKQISVNLPQFIDPNNAVWTPESKRVGGIGMKMGYTFLWTNEGLKHFVTIVQIKDCHVLDTQVSREDGGIDTVTQMILGSHDITDEKYLAGMSREKFEWYDQRGVFPKQFWTGFAVTKNSLLLPGTQITVRHFQPGQWVNVKGKTIERGVQGVMKRWGMKGQPASHGQSKTHRKMGATGGGQDPGRIFPGKKMAGNVGGKNHRTPPLKVMRINTKYDLLYIKGSLPGPIGGLLKITDSPRPKFPDEPPPFPTTFPSDDDVVDEDIFAENVCKPTDPSLEFPPFKI